MRNSRGGNLHAKSQTQDDPPKSLCAAVCHSAGGRPAGVGRRTAVWKQAFVRRQRFAAAMPLQRYHHPLRRQCAVLRRCEPALHEQHRLGAVVVPAGLQRRLPLSDWVITAIQAADVSEYMYEKVEGSKKKQLKEKIPEFIDVDGLNKAAKQNMFMNGNISFGGGNFNWESLMKFCKALGLVEGSKKHGFTQSSDKQFTYYTIYFAANPFEKEDVNVYDDTVQIPWIKMCKALRTFIRTD